MTKLEIIERLARQSGLRRKEVTYIVDNFIEKIKETTLQGERVEIRGFGTFYQSQKKARKIFSPIAGEEIDVPPKVSIAFKPSQTIKKKMENRGA